MLQKASQHFPELNTPNFFSVTRHGTSGFTKENQSSYLSSKLYSHSCKHSPTFCNKLRVSKNVSIRYNINDCDLRYFTLKVLDKYVTGLKL